jgi:hypothetical protein
MAITLNPVGASTDLLTASFASNVIAAANVVGAGIITPANLAAVQAGLVTAASRLIQRYCGGRMFVRATYVEEYIPALDGRVALRQFPVQAVLKVEGTRDTALTISFSPASGQSAWVVFTYTGDVDAETQSVTGLQLSSVTNSVETDTTLLFATYSTLATLAAAINALAGWTAAVGQYGPWPSTALITANTAQGAMSQNGCELEVYTEVLTGCSVDPRTGMLATGRRNSGRTGGPQWGPDWQVFTDSSDNPGGSVRVTYDAGFTTVPLEVQQACAELVLDMIYQMPADQRMASESDGAQSYARNVGDADYALPKNVAGKLSRYVVHSA